MELIKEIYIKDDLPATWKPYYIFLMRVDNHIVGRMTLREGTSEERYYDGHIGYMVEEKYRGHHYAYSATLLMKNIARELGFKELIITCSPDNLASKKTIIRLEAKYLETVTLPKKLRKFFGSDELLKEVYKIEL